MRPLTLLEVVIGFALTAILLAFLFSSFRHIAMVDIEVQKARETVHARTVAHLRLSQVFDNLMEKKEEVSFYTDAYGNSLHPALFLTFDNGIDQDPKFSGPQNAVLYLNSNKQLALSLFVENTERKEILYENAKLLNFEFFNIKTKLWETTWEEKTPPMMIKVQVDKQLFFTFLVPEVG